MKRAESVDAEGGMKFDQESGVTTQKHLEVIIDANAVCFDFVVLNWNEPEVTAALVSDLYPHCKDGSRIIIVDNGSREEQREILRSQLASFSPQVVSPSKAKLDFPLGSITILDVQENCGCTGGYNIGLRFANIHSTCPFVWLFNNDVRISNPSTIPEVRRFLAYRRTPLVCSPPVEASDGQIRLVCRVGPFGFARTQYINASEYKPEQGVAWECDNLIGCSLIISKDILIRIGYLDEDFFLYGEEMDWGLRCRKAGIKMLLLATEPVFHHTPFRCESGTTTVYYKARNSILLTRKYAGTGWGAIPWYLVRVCYLALVVSRAKRNSQLGLREYMTAAFRGIRDGFRGHVGRAL